MLFQPSLIHSPRGSRSSNRHAPWKLDHWDVGDPGFLWPGRPCRAKQSRGPRQCAELASACSLKYPVKFETPLTARAAVRALSASKIRELVNEGFGNPEVLPFWVGEPDAPTPDFIRNAGIASINAGELFYTHNLGIPELREELAAYLTRLHRPTDPGQLAVTSAGVNALMLASQLLVDPGERVVEVVPLWPNLQEIPKILGARVTTVPLDFAPTGWTLNMEKLLLALTPGTRVLYLNSPNNPTGWTISRKEQQTILQHCRRHGIWIFADDAYERLYFGKGGVAPSFLDAMQGDDRISIRSSSFRLTRCTTIEAGFAPESGST